QTHPTAPATGLVPVPVAVLLPTPGADGAESAVRDLPHWHGVTARDAAGLITRLSTVGDLVVELGGHPTIIRAAEHLGRRPAALPGGHLLAAPGRAEPTRRGRLAGLVLTALPRPDVVPGDLGGLSAVMQTWRAGLRPGGYLLTALTTAGCDQGGIEDPATYRAGVIAAARTAGLTWQQEFLVLTAPPPEDEPRAMPGTPLDLPSALVDGKHLRVHVKVLAFRNNTGGGNG
ncbi:MAG: hypothetical protein IRZ05_13645, partial [Micromonosporaceae bacterium]|nr:hypothetical protein [Micromonosporaceae bacterium]